MSLTLDAARRAVIPALGGTLAVLAGVGIKLLERTDRGDAFVAGVFRDRFQLMDIQTEILVAAFTLLIGANVRSTSVETALRVMMAVVVFAAIVGILLRFVYVGYPFAEPDSCTGFCELAYVLWFVANGGALLVFFVATMYVVGKG